MFRDARARTAFPDWPEIADRQAATVRAAADLGDRAAGALAVELSITAGAEFADRYAKASTLPAPTGVGRWAGPAGDVLLSYETLSLPGEDEHRLVVLLSA